uniref:LPXTG cell wall anchor domain-containing protein n=1 Tax=Loa loa TaxID=7209 RepID=A0A1I7V5Q5_LOALO
METYEGPVDSIYRIQDVESEPIEHLVTVYHSGRSDEFVPMEEKKPSVDVGEVFTDAAQALGAKITGLFKRGPAHLDYPTSGPYDGPLASTSLAWDVEGEPLQQHVSVYHSGRSDEPMTKIVEIPTEISLEEVPVVEKPTVTAKIITGLFKKDETYLDYPAMETYEGPVDSIYRIQDVESEPIEHLVTVYHSGRSDEFVPMEEKKPSVDVGEVFTDAAQALGAKITGLFKRGPAHLDYPTSGPYDGPLASTSLAWDVEGEPLQQHVSVYHSGRSDEPMTKIVEIPTEISLEEVPVVEKPTVTAKIITGLFKKDETYLDYPAMETYEGPVDSIYRIQDVESEPIEHLVTVYHSGRSDEFVPMEEKKPSVDVGEVFTDAAQALGAKITGLFKRGPAHLDYPTSGPYDGPLASTSLAWDVEGEPLQQHVSVYHSGRSDEPMTKIVEIPTEISLEEVPVVEKPTVTAKIITGLFKKDETYLDYPAMETYEGPVDSIYRIQDVESEPIEHLVTVYHSGRSDEFVPMEEKKPSVDVGEVFTDAAQALGAKITGLFKRGPAHLDYPTSGPYDGPLASTSLAWDVEGEPLQQHVSVYHSGRSDEPMTKIVEIPTEISLEEVPVVEKPTVTAKIITGLFKKDETYLDYPAMETYEGPVDSIYRIQDVESEPIEHLVTVYHSGRSDEFVPMEEKKPSVDVGEVFTDAAQALGAKITGLFKRGPAHLDYPTSGPYDGPLASTSLAWDVEGEPLQQHVSVYHSGRSDEPMTKIVEIPTEISLEEVPVVEKPTVTAKIITGLFKKDETYLDYPAMETYEGPVDSIYRIQDVESEPIEHLVTVYHSGRSDEFVPMEEKKPSVDVGEVFTDAAQALGAKITGLFKRGPAHLDYPTSGPYDGPLASTSLAWDVEGEPLQQHVSVYHSGRSDEPMTKIVEIPTEISLEEVPVVEKPTVTAKIITGLFKKDETYLDYPAMETYEGPVDSIYRIQDVESEPIEHLVTVYHSGRSDEFVPMEEKKPSVDVGEVFTDAAQALGAKITGLFKRGPAHLDYPTSGPYDGPLASTSLAWDVEGEPLQQHVSVYHSGRSDEPMTKIVEIPTEISLEEVPVVEKPTVTAKIITGLFKKDETYLDYPAMETYEGPVDSIYRIQDVESEPIEHLVTVYHSGRSDEFVPMEEKKPSVDVGEVFTDAAQALGAKITGLFKRGPAHLDYPTSGPYDGPLASTSLAWDVEGEPLQQHVSVYHSGRSDEPMTKIVEIPTEISLEEVPVVEKPTVTAKIITGLFKKDETYLDYPAMETYEGPVDSIYRIQDVESEPIEHLVTVYHSGRSDEFVPMEEKKPSVDVGEVFTDAAQALGAKITGLFKRGPAHLDYPTSGPYDGPLASTSLAWDVEGEPLQQHVSVYHSGRSDEPMTKIVEIPTEISLEEVPVVEKPTVTAKIITGLFKKDETYLDYPAMETYEGPVDSIYRIQDVESEPIEHLVTVYHSGRSDEFVPMEEKKPSVDVGEVFTDAAQALGAKITGLFKRGPAHLDYPTSGPYDGPLASTSLAWDVEGEPLQQHVSVYHSGRSDEPMTKIVEIPTEISLEEVPVVEKPTVTAKIITGLFKKDETYLDYPAMETYEGPVDSIYRIQDVESEPIEHLVTVYHSGRSDEFVPVKKVRVTPTQDRVDGFASSVHTMSMVLLGKKDVLRDHSVSETYVGPLSHLPFSRDVECLPLQLFVNIYHSGRSDLMPGELPFHFFAREDKISDTKVESRLYPPFKDTDFHDRMFQFDNVKPLVPPCTAAYAGNEYKICRPLEPPTSPSKPEHRANDFDISISGRIASGRTLPVGIAHPVPKISEIPKSRHYDEIAEVRRSEVTSTPHDFDYHRKTREVDYWIGRRSERQSKPYRDLTADIGIDLASDVGWEERNIFETQPLETTGIRQSARDYSTYPSKVRARKVSPTAHLHWTTVSEKTSISYKKRISIERRRPHQTSSPQLATYRRQYRPPPPPPEVSAYARHDRAVFESSTLPRTYAGVAIEGDLRMQRARYEASSLPSSYYSSTETRIERNPVRYDLPRPSTPPRYEYWAGERNKWTVEGSPKQFSITDQNGHSAYDDYYMKRTKQEALHYQKSNLEEIPIISLIKDLPMIEDGADECSCASILPASRIETQDLPPGEHSRPSRSAPLRRARQRIRNLCTML